MNQSDTVLLERLAVGIDLGATYSAIAFVDQHGKQRLIPNSENERLTPSVILFDGRHAVVGSVARQNAVAEPEKIVDFVKREMGKSKAQFHQEFEGRKYSAEELSSLIVKKLRGDAEKFLGRAITDAVIAVPAYFNDAQRTATVQAGKLAGLNVIDVINEPTAAALAYDFRQLEGKLTVLVFDLEDGALEVTILDIADNQIRMLASNCDHRLGGKDWDNLIEVEERSRIERCKMICEVGLAKADLEPSQIGGILLVGGMTRMPSVRAMLAAFAPGVPLVDLVNPDEAVALGAAVHANLQLLRGEDQAGARTIPQGVRGQFSGHDGGLIKISNITTHTLGIVIWDHALAAEKVHAMVPRSTRIPASVTKSFGLSKDNLTSMKISVVEGESSVPAECCSVGQFEIEVPPGLPRGTPVSLTYSYTESQLFEIAVEIEGQPRRAKLTRYTGVPEENIALVTAEMRKIEIVQSPLLSPPRSSAIDASATDNGKTVPWNGHLPVTMPARPARSLYRRIPTDVLAALAAMAILACAYATWFTHLSKRDALLLAEVQKLDQDWRAISGDLENAKRKRLQIRAFLDGVRQIVEESNSEKWTPALRSIGLSAGSDVELRVIHVWKNPEDSKGRILRIEGFSTGLEPRAVADRFALQLHEELRKYFQASEGCRFERLDDEPNSSSAPPGQRKAAFTIVAVIGAALPSKAPDNPKN